MRDGDVFRADLGIDSIGVATLNVTLSSPSESIAATYRGDASYASSTSLATTITGSPATQFTMQLIPSAFTVQTKQHATASLTLTSVSSFSDTLQLGCLDLPVAATCTFSSSLVKLVSNGTTTVQLVVDTGNPLGAGSTAELEQETNSRVLLCLLPCLLCVGLGVRRKKIRVGGLLIFLAMISLTLPTAGCSGLNVTGTPPGTYTFKVTASGEGTGTTVSQTVTLTVTR